MLQGLKARSLFLQTINMVSLQQSTYNLKQVYQILATHFSISSMIFSQNQYLVKQMENLKTLEEKIFQKVLQLQHSRMQSRLAFIVLMLCKYLFKDVVILLLFLIPISILQNLPVQFFSVVAMLNLPFTLVITVVLLLYLSIYLFSSYILQGQILWVVQIIVPWLDTFSPCLMIATIHLVFINISQNIILAICNIICLVLFLTIQVVYNMFYFTKSPRTQNLYDVRQARTVIVSSLLILCLSIFLSIQASTSGLPFEDQVLITCSVIHLLLSAIKFKQKIYRKYYVDSLSQNISSIFYFLELNLAILVTLGNILSSQNFIFNNIVPILLSMTVLGYSAVTAYVEHRTSDLVLSNARELKDEQQAILYLDCLCSLVSKVQNEQEDIILISLKKKHTMQCSEANCYCQASKQFKHFVYEYVKCQLAEMTRLFHHSPSILISILYFKLVMFQFYPDILARLSAFSAGLHLSLIDRYHKYSLTQEVKRFIDKRNFEINSIESEGMFRLEQIRLEIQGIIKGEIEVRSKKWKYVSRGLCRISELEHNCNRELKYINRIMTIFNENKVKFKKSKEFNLLLLFYFTKVSFVESGKDVRSNLKQIYYGYRQDELFDLKEFRKFIFHKRSCVFQTLIDDKSLGVITSASQNCEEMFGFPRTEVIGLSINDLMPKFMATQHEFILSEWAKSGTWRTIGKLKEIYCIHKEQYCFSALLYLRIYLKENKMYFITNVFKLNETDYMVLNPSMKIEGLGRKFLRLLGEPAKFLKIDLLVQNVENNNRRFSIDSLVEGKTYSQIFMSVRNLQKEVDSLMLVRTAPSLEDEASRKQQFHRQLKEECEEKYYIEFKVKRYQMGRIWFLVVSMLDARRIERHQTSKYLDNPPTPYKVEFSRNHIEDVEEDKPSQNDHDETEQLLVDHNANSSMTSSSEKQNYSFAKTINKFIGLLQSPSDIRDQRLTKFNCIIIFVLVFLSVINLISFLTYRATLFEIQDIFFANGAVNDIMQSTEIAYSQLYVLQSQLHMGTPIDFSSTLTSLNLIQNYIYSLKQYSFTRLPDDLTGLTSQRIYSYIYHPTQWQTSNRNVSIQTYQFLQQFYYLTGKVLSQLETAQKHNSSFLNSSLFMLFDNFPQLKALNGYFLDSYQQQSNSSHNILNYISIVSLVVYLLATMSLAYVINHYFVFRFNQVVGSFSFFSHIPSQYIQKMKEYYTMLTRKVVNSDRLKHIDNREDQIFSIDTYDLFHKDNNAKGSHNSKIKFINSENYYKWIYIFLILCIVNGINYIATLQIRNFYSPSQKIINFITILMRAQNEVIQSYIDLKSAYYLQPELYLNQNLYDSLEDSLSQVDTQWIQVLEELTVTLLVYDPNYKQKLIYTLVTDICNLTVSEITAFQSDVCVNNIQLKIIEGGIIVAMNFFQRSVRNALEDLKMQYVTRTKPIEHADYFQQQDFVQIDKMLFYMFKVFQKMQAETFTSYINAIVLITNNYLKITLGITIFFILVLLLWIKTIPKQKQQLSLLYGHLLLVPFMILKANSRIVSNLKQAIEYSDY